MSYGLDAILIEKFQYPGFVHIANGDGFSLDAYIAVCKTINMIEIDNKGAMYSNEVISR